MSNEKIRMTLVFEYPLNPNMVERLMDYGTLDSQECLEVDKNNFYNILGPMLYINITEPQLVDATMELAAE